MIILITILPLIILYSFLSLFSPLSPFSASSSPSLFSIKSLSSLVGNNLSCKADRRYGLAAAGDTTNIIIAAVSPAFDFAETNLSAPESCCPDLVRAPPLLSYVIDDRLMCGAVKENAIWITLFGGNVGFLLLILIVIY